MNAADHNNCIRPLLNWVAGPIIESVSTTPLHITLGLGHQNVNIIENMALALDTEVKAADGATSDELNALFTKRGAILRDAENLVEELADAEREIQECVEREDEIKTNNPHYFERCNRVLVNTSPEAVASKSQVRKVKSRLEKDLKTMKKAIEDYEKSLQDTLNAITSWIGQQGFVPCGPDQIPNRIRSFNNILWRTPAVK